MNKSELEFPSQGAQPLSHQFPRIFAPRHISAAKHHSIANWTDHNADARLRQDLKIMLLKL